MIGRVSWRWMLVCWVASGTLQAVEARAQGRQGLAEARNRMVDEEIVAAGVTNPRVIKAMRTTPRHEFVPLAQRRYAYLDMALPIGESQTISPPFVVAYMTELLDPQPSDKVLEIGTGSGYQAAILSGLVREVYTIEIVEKLAHQAAERLKRLGYGNVQVKAGDGYQGWPEHAPFDKIIVTCSPEHVPAPLVAQLKEGGRLIIPVGQRYDQTMHVLAKKNGKMVSEAQWPTLFVPMTGRAEQSRQVQPDPTNPAIRNGDFEELTGQPPSPAVWYYQRQLELVSDGQAPSGKNYVRFRNSQPGRGCQALQGFAVDGRKVRRLELSLWVRGQGIRPGQTRHELPLLGITFYDENRAAVGQRGVGPWRGTFPWRPETRQIDVPAHAHEAILRMGLLGAVGEISFDAIELKPAKN
jgi:protein-L-isoaspartate(D-aspartate) O-methyltransferase